MAEVVDPAVVIDAGADIDDHLAADDGVWLNYGTGTDERAGSETGECRHAGVRMNQQRPGQAAEAFKQAAAHAVIADGDEGVAGQASRQVSDAARDCDPRDAFPDRGRVVVVNGTHFKAAGPGNLDNHRRMPAGTKNDDVFVVMHVFSGSISYCLQSFDICKVFGATGGFFIGYEV